MSQDMYEAEINTVLSRVREALLFRNSMGAKLGRRPGITISSSNIICMHLNAGDDKDLPARFIETFGISLRKEPSTRNFLCYIFEGSGFELKIHIARCFGGEEATIEFHPRSRALCPHPAKEAEG